MGHGSGGGLVVSLVIAVSALVGVTVAWIAREFGVEPKEVLMFGMTAFGFAFAACSWVASFLTGRG